MPAFAGMTRRSIRPSMLAVERERAFRETGVLPPIELSRAVREVHRARLTLQRRDRVTGGIAARAVLVGFRNDHDDMAGSPVFLAACDDQADRTLVGLLLQLGQRACLPPAKSVAEIAQPTEQTVRAYFVDRVAEEEADLLAFRDRLDRFPGPPHARRTRSAGEGSSSRARRCCRTSVPGAVYTA